MYEVWTQETDGDRYHSAYPAESWAQDVAAELNELLDADVYAWVVTA